MAQNGTSPARGRQGMTDHRASSYDRRRGAPPTRAEVALRALLLVAFGHQPRRHPGTEATRAVAVKRKT
ncbi:hypothetical protein [Thiohalomonas denitrificans]|uniref:hypothetical protein n=1 Tax=Thiohalomonas denitrificans TaxID=415747 RepID=UPI001113CF70|nr:hypothetical protein [Thiohalomonas denitrificans]